MVAVAIWGSLQSATGGAETIELEAKTLKELLNALGEQFPQTRPQIERGISVVIDGRLYNDGWFTPIKANSEVVLLPRVEGG